MVLNLLSTRERGRERERERERARERERDREGDRETEINQLFKIRSDFYRNYGIVY